MGDFLSKYELTPTPIEKLDFKNHAKIKMKRDVNREMKNDVRKDYKNVNNWES